MSYDNFGASFVDLFSSFFEEVGRSSFSFVWFSSPICEEACVLDSSVSFENNNIN